MDFVNDLDLLLRSRYTLICIKSYEEERVVGGITSLCERSKRKCLLWDHADFFKVLTEGHDSSVKAKDPLSALEQIEKMDGECVFILRDFHQCWKNQPRIVRSSLTR